MIHKVPERSDHTMPLFAATIPSKITRGIVPGLVITSIELMLGGGSAAIGPATTTAKTKAGAALY
jgi:hypothetical protein